MVELKETENKSTNHFFIDIFFGAVSHKAEKRYEKFPKIKLM